ncbi:hypothetical protein OAH88_02025 [Candidatus Pelagibacter sp.]|nr:hypothetical protein [Candidatus Pelagibacter sp.]
MANINANFKSINSFNKYFFFYLSILFLLGIYYLHYKHNAGSDSSISEYLINYQGGFVRRGLPGEILFRYSDYFNLNLRFQIFLFQSIIYSIFLLLTFILFKDFKKNGLILFAIYTPIFLLFPIAELESLGRKETVLYVFFLSLILIKNKKNANIFTLIALPLTCAIYEEVVLFTPFIYSVILLKNKINDIKSAIKLSLLFIPSIIIVALFFIFPMTSENHMIMANGLMNTFGEECYMSCSLLVKNDINSFSKMLDYIWGGSHVNLPSILIRYFLIILIGFFPIFLLSYFSYFKDDIFFSKIKLKNIFLFLVLCYIPIIPLFLLGGDWGRWVGLTISFTTIFYFYLYKNNFVNVNFILINQKLSFFRERKKLVTLLFIIFAFGWNQKTTSVEDVATNPLYKIPYNTAKRIFGWGSFQILQDSTIIKWHKNIIE